MPDDESSEQSSAAPPAGASDSASSSSVLADAGSGADSAFSDQPASLSVQPCRKKTWVGIELVDNKGRPVPGRPYRIELPDGRVVEGTLDAMGTAGVTGIDPGTCKITFPKLDAKSWKRPA